MTQRPLGGPFSAVLERVHKHVSRLARRLRGVEHKVVHLAPDRDPRGRALLSFFIDPFLLSPAAAVGNSHTHHWDSVVMAATLLDLGFAVDVIHWTNDRFQPEHKYDLLVDPRYNVERLARALGPTCRKLMHLDTAHWRFHNTAELTRLTELRERRGVDLRPRRQMAPSQGIDHADAATLYGNRWTLTTYTDAGALKPLLPVPMTSPCVYPPPDGKDFESARQRFLWLGSGGLVHKGLDLVLEAFAGMPDLHLTVCGPIGNERDFTTAYARELRDTPNIEVVGWTDVGGEAFYRIARRSLGVVYASCSEGQNGGVVTCLHAGLIPVVSRESGVDVDPSYGIRLESTRVETIQHAVRSLSARSTGDLRDMAHAAWAFARAHHGREHFAAAYRRAVEQVMSGEPAR